MLIRELSLKGILSFGPNSPPLAMRSLNVLIGPNGSGKSNFLEAIGLLRSTPGKLAAPMRGTGGGVREWIWKGSDHGNAEIAAVIDYPCTTFAFRHSIVFTETSSRLDLVDEVIEPWHADSARERSAPFYQYRNGQSQLFTTQGGRRELNREDVAPDESILSQLRDPKQLRELTYLADMYGAVRLYREWSFGRSSVFRRPQAADLPSNRLEEDFSNLGLFLNHLRSVPKAKNQIIERLRDLYEGLEDFDVRVKGGTVEVFLTEGDFIIPATRLSDGTLRYLCLLAILCDPVPPPLVCIEEPELGLHPDMLPKLADLLIAASGRTQIVVTTHSDILVDAMTEHPEAVVVVEKVAGQTQATRLKNDDELQEWLKKYRLGQLWTRGEIGGTRW